MKIGLVGYQGSGKSTLFGWLTGTPPDPAAAHTSQSAMAMVHDPRVKDLVGIYKPKKITEASIELTDTPGLARDHKGNAARLALIRDVDCLLIVVAAFGGNDPAKDLASFQEDIQLADLEIITGRIGRLEESIKKPRPDRDEQKAELELLKRIQTAIENGQPISELSITQQEEKMIRSFQLLVLKRQLAIVNTVDDEPSPQRFRDLGSEKMPVLPVPVGLEAELSQMEPSEAAAFREELGAKSFDRDALTLQIMDASGQMLFFTAGDKEVRTWLFHKGGTAVEAADGIHSDLARGFIRAETMTCADILRLKSEREVKAAGLMRNEPKDYVVQDGDIINIKFSV
jgi:ribosome-binding ATPase YchF (GTP1/OBG family)